MVETAAYDPVADTKAHDDLVQKVPLAGLRVSHRAAHSIGMQNITLDHATHKRPPLGDGELHSGWIANNADEGERIERHCKLPFMPRGRPRTSARGFSKPRFAALARALTHSRRRVFSQVQ